MDQGETEGGVVILVNGLPPSISLTFSVSMSAGVKSSSGDLWIFLYRTPGPPTQRLSFSGADNAFPPHTHLDVEKSAFLISL